MYSQACSIVPYYVKCVIRALLSFVWFGTHKVTAKLNVCVVHYFQIPLLKSKAVTIDVGYYAYDVLNLLFFTRNWKITQFVRWYKYWRLRWHIAFCVTFVSLWNTCTRMKLHGSLIIIVCCFLLQFSNLAQTRYIIHIYTHKCQLRPTQIWCDEYIVIINLWSSQIATLQVLQAIF